MINSEKFHNAPNDTIVSQREIRNRRGALVAGTVLDGLGGTLMGVGAETGKTALVVGGALIFTAGTGTTYLVREEVKKVITKILHKK